MERGAKRHSLSDMKREIVLGFDPEHGGQDALDLGALLAEVLAAKIVVVTALPWPQSTVELQGIETKLEEQMETPFADARQRLSGLDVETRAIASGTASSALADVARSDEAQLLVIGSSHRGPLGRTLAGSVGESLLHGAPCAVAVAPHGYGARAEKRLQRIAVAFDGSPEAWIALETAIGMTERCHAKLSVLTVADYPRYGYSTAWTLVATGELQDAERDEKQSTLRFAVSRIPDEYEADSRVLTGEPADLLTQATAEHDLMVTGSRSWGPLRRTMLGSTTRKLIRSAQCPVLVVPRGVGMDPLGVRATRALSAGID
jgi:nucleotide-binding universal stress UspA family protein